MWRLHVRTNHHAAVAARSVILDPQALRISYRVGDSLLRSVLASVLELAHLLAYFRVGHPDEVAVTPSVDWRISLPSCTVHEFCEVVQHFQFRVCLNIAGSIGHNLNKCHTRISATLSRILLSSTHTRGANLWTFFRRFYKFVCRVCNLCGANFNVCGREIRACLPQTKIASTIQEESPKLMLSAQGNCDCGVWSMKKCTS